MVVGDDDINERKSIIVKNVKIDSLNCKVKTIVNTVNHCISMFLSSSSCNELDDVVMSND